MSVSATSAPLLDADQRAAWHDQGCLVLPGFVSDAETAALRGRAAELVDGFEPVGVAVDFDSPDYEAYLLDAGDRIHFFVEPDALDGAAGLNRPKQRAMGKIGRALHELDPVFDAFSRSPRLARLVAALGVREPLLLQSQYIFKQPGIGQAFPLHQDGLCCTNKSEGAIPLTPDGFMPRARFEAFRAE